jgi:hypothetical protein
MRQSTTENLQRFIEGVDDFKQRIAEWLNRKAVAIPLRVVRIIFICYIIISVFVFTFLLFYGDEILQAPVPANWKIDSLRHLPNSVK